MRLLKMILCACLSLAIMTAIFFLSSQTSGESGSLSESIALMIARAFWSGFDGLDAIEQARIVEDLTLPVRKAAHASEYAVLGASLVATCWQVRMFVLERSGDHEGANLRRAAKGQFAIGFASSVLYAASDELHQLFVDGRSGQLGDVLIDAGGSLIGCALCFAAIYAMARRESKRASKLIA